MEGGIWGLMSDSPKDPPAEDTPALPTPEEITRKLEDFIKNSLGGQVMVTHVEGGRRGFGPEPEGNDEVEEEPEADEASFDFRYKPADIKEYLDRFVIRQDEAKKVLATAVCDHYNHARILAEERKEGRTVEFSKQNVLIAGPTGVGKTYLVKHIAELIGVPFVKADATKFSETGYVGGDVDDLVRDLVAKANGNVALAEHGIIYLDEVDKLASGGGERMGRDVSGRGVQTALLKLMEETEVSLYAPNDIRSQMQMMFDSRKGRTGREVVNTRNILFIVSGAFSGLEKIIKKRRNKAAIGFGSAPAEEERTEDLMKESGTRDFIDYGFEAEFIGRLPVRVVCTPLSAEDLYQIMKCSEGSLIRQYERELAAYGIRAVFEDEALRLVAERAAEEKTGARGLVTAWEKILRDFKFELPSLGLPELVVGEFLIKEPVAALERCREAARAFEATDRGGEVVEFARRFGLEHGFALSFEVDTVAALVTRAEREGVTVGGLCARLFKDFPFGLKLVANAGGGNRVVVPLRGATDPDAFLSELVVRSYGREAPSPALIHQVEPNIVQEEVGDEVR